MPAESTPTQKVGAGTESRQYPRERFASTVQLLLSGRHIVEGRSLDISVGGLLVVVPVNLAVQSNCTIRFLIPGIPDGAHQVMARTQITSNVFSGKENGFLVGLRFTTIGEVSLSAIREYLHERIVNTHRPNRLRGYSPGEGM